MSQTRTLNEAYQLARPLAAAGNPQAATALLSRLLWHVSADAGGFSGLSDSQLRAKCEGDKRLSYAAATAAMYAPGPFSADAVTA